MGKTHLGIWIHLSFYNMKTFLRRDIRSILFVATLTLIGITIAFMLMYELNDREKLGAILVLISSALSAIGIGLSIKKSNAVDE